MRCTVNNIASFILHILTYLFILLPNDVPCASIPVVTALTSLSEEISAPLRVASDITGNIFLSDLRSNGVLKFDNGGKLIKMLMLQAPHGIAVAPNGDLVVSQGNQVSVLDGNGVEKFRLGKGSGQFKMANGVAIDAAGYIYVVDSRDNCVQVFTAAGAPVTMANSAPGKPTNSFGSSGDEAGQLHNPTGIAYEKISDQVAVADTFNNRIQFFDTTGSYRKTIGSIGSGPLKFTYPQGITFEYDVSTAPPQTRMYVVDSYQSNIQVIDPANAGSFLRFIGSYGHANGQLMVPTDAAFDPVTSRLLVVNGYGNLTIYGINGGSTPHPPTTPPALTINAVPARTGSTTLTISGTMEAGATVSVNSSLVVVSGTNWSSTITGLVPGPNLITVTATDNFGNTTTKSVTVIVDVSAPAIGINPIISPTNNPTQTITGIVGAGAVVTVVTDTTAIAGPVSFPSPTTWKCTINGLAAGNNRIAVTAAKDGVVATAEAVITLDRTILSLSTLSNGSTTTVQIQNLTGSVGPTIKNVQINGQDISVTNGLFSIPLLFLAGANTITVTAADVAGNSYSEERVIYYDPKAPAMEFNSPADGAVMKNPVITVSGIAPNGGIVTINGTATQKQGTAWNATITLTAGMNTLEAVITDISGKSSSIKRTVIHDPGRPELAIISPVTDLATNRASIVVKGSVTYGNGVILSATENGVTQPIAIASDGSFTHKVTLTSEGVYPLTLTAVDSAGNVSSSIRTFIFDTTPPLLTMEPLATAKPTRISGTIEAGATLHAIDKTGNPIGTLQVGNGKWNLDLPTGYDPAAINIFCQDAAGNSSRNGDNNNDGKVNIADAVRAMRIAAGLDKANTHQLLAGDVAPLRNHLPQPDGVIDIEDVIVIMQRVVGLPW